MKTIEELQKEIEDLTILKVKAIREERYTDAADCRDKVQLLQEELDQKLKDEGEK